jgi:propionyl-CoA carboxylase alpha chain
VTITSLLVANRGEIARRVFRTARAMGMNCIGVYVDADAEAPFVGEADLAVRLDTGYLDVDAVIAAAIRSGADAVHPGYGFLSENAGFALAVEAAGLTWVGPPPSVIEAMGDKIAAKRIAIAAGVTTLASSDDPTQDGEVGYPLLVKASAGGGGKGMRVVLAAADLGAAVDASKREAASAFGDDRVFLERYVARSRHVEIQILGDRYGSLVHLGERECSIQRRHQKIIEESPSPVVDHAMRSSMGDAALALARSIGYESAGTVEFLVDDDTRAFFFLEVNTRLQVEHAVTEEITGIDLVREQLRVAAGEPLGYHQDDISFTGHAIEARLYAEDPAAGFLPARGTLAAFAPADKPRVRIDSGVESGSTVGVDFDPMLAKLIACAPTRREAAGRLALALERLHLGGVTTNRDFLAVALRSDAFLDGATTTDFIDRLDTTTVADADHDDATVIGALWLQGANRIADTTWPTAPSNWRNARLPAEYVTFALGDGERRRVEYRADRDGSFRLEPQRRAVVHRWSGTDIDISVDGVRRVCRVTRAGQVLHVQMLRTTIALTLVPRFPSPDSEAPTGGLVAPMPGAVIDVRVDVGESVEAGQLLVVLEAMKMEHHVTAPFAGVVDAIVVSVGDQVDTGALLLTIDAPPAGTADG